MSLPDAAAPVSAAPRLFEPLTLRGITLKNRIAVSPMSMYSSRDGFSDDFHLVHLGRFALGGAGLVMLEASAVAPEGRITEGCNGIWLDAHVPGLKRITDFLKRFGAVPAIQLGHSGPKGSAQRPWHGNGPLAAQDSAARGEQPWPLLSAAGNRYGDGWSDPREVDERDMDLLLRQYRDAVRRAREAGFGMLELHCAHGYLLHDFLSPLTNGRTDQYGGSLENRMRFPLQVAEAVREEWPARLPMAVRISAVDGVGAGWTIEDSVAFARELAARGIDLVACSSGGIRLPRQQVLPSGDPGFQVPFAARVRREADMRTIAVGMIRTPQQAEEVLAAGDADIVALGREMLVDPNWAVHAALALDPARGWQEWPEQYGWWLERRARQLDKQRPA